jgi:hypothetical protein
MVFRFAPIHFTVAMHVDINVINLQTLYHYKLIQRPENVIVIYEDHQQ